MPSKEQEYGDVEYLALSPTENVIWLAVSIGIQTVQLLVVCYFIRQTASYVKIGTSKVTSTSTDSSGHGSGEKEPDSGPPKSQNRNDHNSEVSHGGGDKAGPRADSYTVWTLSLLCFACFIRVFVLQITDLLAFLYQLTRNSPDYWYTQWYKENQTSTEMIINEVHVFGLHVRNTAFFINVSRWFLIILINIAQIQDSDSKASFRQIKPVNQRAIRDGLIVVIFVEALCWLLPQLLIEGDQDIVTATRRVIQYYIVNPLVVGAYLAIYLKHKQYSRYLIAKYSSKGLTPKEILIIEKSTFDVLVFFILICQVLIIESVYRVVAISMLDSLSSEDEMRFRYLYWIVRSFSIILMFIGVSYSLKSATQQNDHHKSLSVGDKGQKRGSSDAYMNASGSPKNRSQNSGTIESSQSQSFGTIEEASILLLQAQRQDEDSSHIRQTSGSIYKLDQAQDDDEDVHNQLRMQMFSYRPTNTGQYCPKMSAINYEMNDDEDNNLDYINQQIMNHK